MFKEWSERGRSKVTIPLGIEVGTNDPLLIPIELSSSSELTGVSHDLGGAEGDAADVEEVQQQGEAPIAERSDTEEEVQQPTPSPKLPPRRTTQGKRDAVRGGAKEGAAKERPKRAAHPRDLLKYERLGVPKALLVQEEEYEEEKGAEGEMEQICCFGVNLPHEPTSMEEALARDDREAWLASREDEFQSHMENETWTLTNLPPGRKALDCTWVLRVKTDAEGRLERRKTRLVIKGFQQREGIDFQEVFAPVAKAPTLRLLLAAAAICGWKVEQMDVKTAFLYGVVDKEIYMKQPEGYDDGSGHPDAPDIPTPHSYVEAIEGPYSSQWLASMDAEMASWKSTGTYVDEVPPPGANIVSGMWIFRVKRLPGSLPVFKARYVARGFSQRQGVEFFHAFSPTPKMTTLRVLLHVAAQRDYELHSLDFITAFLQGCLHEEI
ncbi:unnamed protein product [Closterium sp. NIES-54]